MGWDVGCMGKNGKKRSLERFKTFEVVVMNIFFRNTSYKSRIKALFNSINLTKCNLSNFIDTLLREHFSCLFGVSSKLSVVYCGQ